MSVERIGQYQVHRMLGAGGMGEVYLAEDPSLRRKVALKLLPERFTDDPERIRRFQREARAASQLNHPNIITIYEVGRDGRRHYIATEYIEGQTLRERIRSPRPVRVLEVVDVAIGIASALTTAHAAGILHRDIKPENVMVRPDGYVKVLDFGLAKLSEGDSLLKDSTTSAVMGTLLYLSPEQAQGAVPDARADVYSLAAVMYEMLTRRPPVTADNFVEFAIAVATRQPEPPSRYAPDIPHDLDRIVMKGLQKDPRSRYQSAEQILDDLRALRRQIELEHPEGTGSSAELFAAAATAIYPSRRSSEAFRRRPARFGLRQVVALALILLSAAVLAYAIGHSEVFAEGPIDSIAVLPFVNVSGDPNSEYLSDGIAESIIDSLARLPRLQVVARSTAFRFKGRSVDPVVVGGELHVRGVVTGQLIARGDTLIIRAALVDVKKGTQVWGEQYNRRMADVLAVQREMSQEISSGLQMKLTGEEQRLIVRESTVSPEAYQAYLRGRYHLNKLTEEEVKRALDLFSHAIELQPNYALAYAGIASAYYQLSNIYMAPNEAMPLARVAAERAVSLDDSLPEAHAALALVRTWYDWDFVAGEKEFRRAIELNPGSADAHRLYGDFLVVTRQFQRAIDEKRRAEQLDPLSLPASWDLGRALFYSGRIDEAAVQLRKTLDLDDKFPNAYVLEAQIALARGRTGDALASANRAMAVGGRKPFFLSMWGYISALAGHRNDAQEAIAELQKYADYTLPLFLARVNTGLGNRDEALRSLEQLRSERSESIVWLLVDPTLQTLRGDPRFIELAHRVGI